MDPYSNPLIHITDTASQYDGTPAPLDPDTLVLTPDYSANTWLFGSAWLGPLSPTGSEASSWSFSSGGEGPSPAPDASSAGGSESWQGEQSLSAPSTPGPQRHPRSKPSKSPYKKPPTSSRFKAGHPWSVPQAKSLPFRCDASVNYPPGSLRLATYSGVNFSSVSTDQNIPYDALHDTVNTSPIKVTAQGKCDGKKSTCTTPSAVLWERLRSQDSDLVDYVAASCKDCNLSKFHMRPVAVCSSRTGSFVRKGGGKSGFRNVNRSDYVMLSKDSRSGKTRVLTSCDECLEKRKAEEVERDVQASQATNV